MPPSSAWSNQSSLIATGPDNSRQWDQKPDIGVVSDLAQQLCCFDAERVRECVDVVEAHVPLAPFNATDICAMKIRRVREGFLTEPALCSEFAKTRTKGLAATLAWVQPRHGANAGSMMTISRQTISSSSTLPFASSARADRGRWAMEDSAMSAKAITGAILVGLLVIAALFGVRAYMSAQAPPEQTFLQWLNTRHGHLEPGEAEAWRQAHPNG